MKKLKKRVTCLKKEVSGKKGSEYTDTEKSLSSILNLISTEIFLFHTSLLLV
jgi:hypothetical protein